MIVITGLDPVIHLRTKAFCEDGWMPGSSPGMTSAFVSPTIPQIRRRDFTISRREAPELCKNLSPPWRAWGMPGARCTRSPLCNVESTGVEATGTPESPGIPARNGFNGFLRALPGDRALLPPSSADMVLSKPGRADLTSAKLDASVGASGPHDFAVRNNISRPRAVDRSQVPKNPPCDPVARKTLPRPPHPVPYVRDDRETPLCVGRDAKSSRCDLGGTKTEIFLQMGLDTRVDKLPDGQISRPVPFSFAQDRCPGIWSANEPDWQPANYVELDA